MRQLRVLGFVLGRRSTVAHLGIATACAALALSIAADPAAAQKAMVSDNPRFCLAADGTLTACTTGENRFEKTYSAARNAFVFNTPSGTCLDAGGGKGNRVRLSSCNGSLAQDWFITGNRRIQSKANSLCLDVEREGFVQGNPVVLWDCRGNASNQNFALAEVLAASGEPTTSISSIGRTIKNGEISGSDLIASGSGYVIAAGGYNVIAAGGANANGQGRGNGRQAERVIGAGGGNVSQPDAVIAAGGANVEQPDQVIAAGGYNVDESGNVIAAGGANVIGAGGYNLLGTSAEPTASGQLSVVGRSNLFAAGRSAGPALEAAGGGELPPSIPVSGSGSVAFPTIVGSIGCCNSANGPPDGNTDWPSTNIDAYGGISGMVHQTRIMFLAGVFLRDGEPGGAAPSSRDLTNDNNEQLIAPGVGQIFFIGDGKDASGQVQRYAVPEGATRLFFGFGDAQGFVGTSAYYFDNLGELAVSYQIYPAG